MLHTMLPYITLFAILSQLVNCTIFNVTVGGPGSLVYDPESVDAEVGDTIRFIFEQRNHTVTQSTFENPCQRLQGGFDTGFIPVADSATGSFPVAELTITNTSPVWAFCAQGQHCQRGMVFAVNPGNNFAAFKAAAMGGSTGASSSSSAPTPNQAPPPSATTTSRAPPSGAPGNSPVAVPAPSSSVAVVTVVATVTATDRPTPNVQPTPSASTPLPLVDYKVIVGGYGSSQLTFQPSFLKANIGDTVTFEFHQKNHTVTASSFVKPCEPLSRTSSTGEVGFDSGFVPVGDTVTSNFPTYTIRVNDTKTIWAYCRQGNHCGQGMVFAVNALGSGPNTFAAFQALAKQQTGSTSSAHSSDNASAPRARVAGFIIVTPVVATIAAFLL